jgi:hypothetical protein
MTNESIWVFHGAESRYTSAVFTERAIAEAWIFENALSGMLTKYPLNVGIYDWAIQNGYFTPKKEAHTSPDFIGKFTTASQEHFHYENGKLG